MIRELNALRDLAEWVVSLKPSLDAHSRIEMAIKLGEVLESHREDTLLPNLLDSYGELYRRSFFVGDGLGCYDTMSLSEEFKEVSRNSELGGLLLSHLFGDQQFFDDREKEDEFSKACLFSSKRNVVAWYWDGAGTLLLGDIGPDGSLSMLMINNDCKKTYGWERVLPKGE